MEVCLFGGVSMFEEKGIYLFCKNVASCMLFRLGIWKLGTPLISGFAVAWGIMNVKPEWVSCVSLFEV